MATDCCAGVIQNTGTPSNCGGAKHDVRHSSFITLQTDGDGNANKIDLSDTLNDAYIEAKINDPNPLKRWYPIPLAENVTETREDPEYQTFPSGRKTKLRDGIYSVSMEIYNVDEYYARQIEWMNCRKVGEFVRDISGNLHGDVTKESGFLHLRKFQENTFNAKYVPPTDGTKGHLLITFDYVSTLRDVDMGYIPSSGFESDVDLLEYEGRIDLQGTVQGTVTTTGFTMDIFSNHNGTVGTPYEDLTTTNILVYNETTDAEVTGLVITETPEGTYGFAYDAQTISDVLHVEVVSGIPGYGLDDQYLRLVQATITA